MEQPNYVLRTNEAVLMPVQDSKGKRFLKIGVSTVLGILVLGSLFFGDNLFMELSGTTRLLLIILAIGVLLFGTKREDVPSPMELQFFDDYLILYLPKRYYSRRITRREVNKLKYSDITKCVYNARLQRVHIYGGGVSEWYNYDAKGNLPDKPTKTNAYDEGLIYFRTLFATDVDFKKEIEEHSPLTVIVENS